MSTYLSLTYIHFFKTKNEKEKCVLYLKIFVCYAYLQIRIKYKMF